ncbi:hypothetical protein [Jiulongibacter sediminis]|uniref:hypothetical protein n=1 Tax=Jiulongibacter sediminis TaxID=1605367 RepID=UPI0026ECA968|nr:hypothetical protein [Jiulongibacter sediminis]
MYSTSKSINAIIDHLKLLLLDSEIHKFVDRFMDNYSFSSCNKLLERLLIEREDFNRAEIDPNAIFELNELIEKGFEKFHFVEKYQQIFRQDQFAQKFIEDEQMLSDELADEHFKDLKSSISNSGELEAFVNNLKQSSHNAYLVKILSKEKSNTINFAFYSRVLNLLGSVSRDILELIIWIRLVITIVETWNFRINSYPRLNFEISRNFSREFFTSSNAQVFFERFVDSFGSTSPGYHSRLSFLFAEMKYDGLIHEGVREKEFREWYKDFFSFPKKISQLKNREEVAIEKLWEYYENLKRQMMVK